MSGTVVGVVVAQLSVLQNVNFAIQPSMVINFLEVKDVTPKLDTPKAPRSPTEVCEIATKFTIQVYCQGRTPPKTATGTAGPLALSHLTLRISAPDHERPRPPIISSISGRAPAMPIFMTPSTRPEAQT